MTALCSLSTDRCLYRSVATSWATDCQRPDTEPSGIYDGACHESFDYCYCEGQGEWCTLLTDLMDGYSGATRCSTAPE